MRRAALAVTLCLALSASARSTPTCSNSVPPRRRAGWNREPFAKDKPARAAFLASIWSGPARRNAFTHVLCGDDWDTDELGGLHLEARYQ